RHLGGGRLFQGNDRPICLDGGVCFALRLQLVPMGTELMPLYEFKCKKCDDVEELLLPIGGTPNEPCSKCGGKSRTKLISQVNTHDDYSFMSPRKGRGRGGAGRLGPGIGPDFINGSFCDSGGC